MQREQLERYDSFYKYNKFYLLQKYNRFRKKLSITFGVIRNLWTFTEKVFPELIITNIMCVEFTLKQEVNDLSVEFSPGLIWPK